MKEHTISYNLIIVLLIDPTFAFFLVAKYLFVLFVISPADYPAVWSAHMLSSLLAFLLLGRPNRRKAGRKSLGSNPYYLW